MTTKVLKDGTVLAFDEATQSIQVLRQASILIEDGCITAIAANSNDLSPPPGAEIIDVTGKIVSPGFVNTHVHMWQSVYRTIGPNIILGQYFGWLSQFSETATAAFTPGDVYISALEGYLEGLNAGVTSYVEHAHNNWRPDIVKPGYDAAVDSGARVWWCYDVASRPGFSVEQQWSLLETIPNPKAPSVHRGISLDGLAGSMLNGDAVVLEQTKNRIMKLNAELITMHHMGGPWPQGNTSPTKICSDVHQLQKMGLPIILSHAPFLTDSDLESLRKHNLFISITPESECQFGHGQATSHLISDQASLGVDTTWTFSGDMLGQTRLWLQTVRRTLYAKTLERGLLPNASPMFVEQAFLLATRQGGRAVRRNDVGVIKVGAKADLVVFQGGSPNMLGWSDPIAAVVLHANPGDVEHVLVDGEWRKRDFQLVNLKKPWLDVQSQFLEAARRIQLQVKEPVPLPEKLWGVGEFGDVEVASTVL